MTKTQILRVALVLVASAMLAGCITDPRLNAGLSLGEDGVTMQPSIQANVGGGLLQYTPDL